MTNFLILPKPLLATKMSPLKVKIKKLNPNAVVPKYAKPGDAGLDLTAVSKTILTDNVIYGTGLAFEIPSGYVGLVFPRSSLSKYDLILSNHVGVIDSGYRGEVMLNFKTYRGNYISNGNYSVGDRIGQILIIPYPEIQFEETNDLSSSERGSGGFGSTG